MEGIKYRYEWDVMCDTILGSDWSIYKRHKKLSHNPLKVDDEIWEFYVDRWWKFKRVDEGRYIK